MEQETEPICIVGESGKAIYHVVTDGEEWLYCDEVMSLACSALEVMLPHLNPTCLAFASPDTGDIIPFSDVIRAGATVQLRSVKNDPMARSTRDAYVKAWPAPRDEEDLDFYGDVKDRPILGEIVVEHQGLEITIPLRQDEIDEFTLRRKACEYLGLDRMDYKYRIQKQGGPSAIQLHTFYPGDHVSLVQVSQMKHNWNLKTSRRRGLIRKKKVKPQLPIQVTTVLGQGAHADHTVEIETTIQGHPTRDIIRQVCLEQGLDAEKYALCHRGCLQRDDQQIYPGTRCQLVKIK
uniref:Uncharacterized protein n=1 Tax=viral metagenome TaxID=1070528 RepID=A0A6C0BLY4_9ZZZZ